MKFTVSIEMNKLDQSLKNRYLFILAFLIGVLSFLSIYGISPLNPFCDNFIFWGYDEKDINQHYAGWVLFLTDDWHFPLGYTDKISSGTIISYTDSIPLFAIFFKFVFKLINYQGTFQYFGIYTLLCYVLQAFAAGLIIRRKTNNIIVLFFAMILLCFSPILMERAFRHTALGSQFLILFAIYSLLKGRDSNYRKFPWIFALLGCVAITTHPYFLPLVFGFCFVYFIESVRYGEKKFLKVNSISFIFSIGITLIVGYLIGVIGHGVNVSRGIIGFYSMNLNAIINSTSYGGYKWSAFLKTYPQTLGNYDGFNYLGIGNLLLIFTILIASIILLPKEKIKSILFINKYLILLCIFLTCFAVSQVVTFNQRILFTIPLPYSFLKICGIFGASSRMFYGPYYCLIIYAIYSLITFTNTPKSASEFKVGRFFNKTSFLIVLFVSLQLVDLNNVRIEKHKTMKINNLKEFIIDNYVSNNIHNFSRINAFEFNYSINRNIGIIAGKNNLSVDYPIANSGSYKQAYEYTMRLWSNLVKGKNEQDTIFVTKNRNFAEQIATINKALKIATFEDSYMLFPQNKNTNLDNNLYLAFDIDQHLWNIGYKNTEPNEIVLYKDTKLSDIINSFSAVIANDHEIKIASYYEEGNFIKIKLCSDVKDIFSLPAIVHFKK